MSTNYKTYKLENGKIITVEENSSADTAADSIWASERVPGLDTELNNSGIIVSNTPKYISNAGRFYLYTNRRWVTDSDDLYGSNYPIFNESAGTGENPEIEWEHMGTLLPAKTRLSKLMFLARCNSTQLTDVEIRIYVRKPNPITRYDSGIDNDTEMSNDLIYQGNFVEPGMSGNMVDRRLKTIDLGDFELTDTSEISIYLKPIGNLTSTRYLYATWTWELK